MNCVSVGVLLASIKELIKEFLDEIKAILQEYFNETETKVKEHLKKLVITSVITSVLLALVVSFLSSAVLFITVGSLKYLKTFMPAWQAWIVMGLNSIVFGVAFLVTLFVIIRRKLKSSPKSEIKPD
jgi:uncharacterized BrkB/YihY/UPF0761 family membrane protein